MILGDSRIIDEYKESLSALYFSHVIMKWYSSSVWCPGHMFSTQSGGAYRLLSLKVIMVTCVNAQSGSSMSKLIWRL